MESPLFCYFSSPIRVSGCDQTDEWLLSSLPQLHPWQSFRSGVAAEWVKIYLTKIPYLTDFSTAFYPRCFVLSCLSNEFLVLGTDPPLIRTTSSHVFQRSFPQKGKRKATAKASCRHLRRHWHRWRVAKLDLLPIRLTWHDRLSFRIRLLWNWLQNMLPKSKWTAKRMRAISLFIALITLCNQHSLWMKGPL